MTPMEIAIKSMSVDVENFMVSILWKHPTISTMIMTLIILFFKSSRFSISRRLW
jgi:hypothetical protein